MIFQSIFRLHNYAFSASYHKKFQQVKYCQYNLQQPQGTACFLSAGLRSGHFDSILSIGLIPESFFGNVGNYILRIAGWFHTPLNIQMNHIILIQIFREIRCLTDFQR